MRKVLHIAQNDLRLFLVQRGNLVGLLLTPLLMTVMIRLAVLGFSGSATRVASWTMSDPPSGGTVKSVPLPVGPWAVTVPSKPW